MIEFMNRFSNEIFSLGWNVRLIAPVSRAVEYYVFGLHLKQPQIAWDWWICAANIAWSRPINLGV